MQCPPPPPRDTTLWAVPANFTEEPTPTNGRKSAATLVHLASRAACDMHPHTAVKAVQQVVYRVHSVALGRVFARIYEFEYLTGRSADVGQQQQRRCGAGVLASAPARSSCSGLAVVFGDLQSPASVCSKAAPSQ